VFVLFLWSGLEFDGSDTGFGKVESWILKADGGNLIEQVGGGVHSPVSMDMFCCFSPSYSQVKTIISFLVFIIFCMCMWFLTLIHN
jgi:hypothetical protein